MGHSLTLASYNILHPRFAAKHKQEPLPPYVTLPWTERAQGIKANLHDADIVCLQETAPDIIPDVCGRFNAVTHAMHKHEGHESIHGTGIIANANAGTVKQTFSWLAPGENSRRAACAIFTLPDKGPRILVASIHPDGYFEYAPDLARVEADKEDGYRQLAYYLEQAAEYKMGKVDAIVIAGDFNEHYMPRGIEFNRHVLMGIHDFRDDEHLDTTEPSTGRKLDWIYVWSKRNFSLHPVYGDPPHPEVSDHLPVKSRLTFG